jgi:hypothetical protein
VATEKEIRKLVEPILQSRRDVVYVKRSLFLVPIDHIVRFCFFNGSAIKGAFYIQYGSMRLAQGHFPLTTVGGDAFPTRLPAMWNVQRPDCSEMVQEAFEQTVAPKLAQWNDFASLVAFHRSKPDRTRMSSWEIAQCLLCLGRFSEARDEMWERLSFLCFWLDRYGPVWEFDKIVAMKPKMKPYWDDSVRYLKHLREIARFQKLALESPRALLDEIATQEAQVIAEMGLEKYWTPTPLPCPPVQP